MSLIRISPQLALRKPAVRLFCKPPQCDGERAGNVALFVILEISDLIAQRWRLGKALAILSAGRHSDMGPTRLARGTFHIRRGC